MLYVKIYKVILGFVLCHLDESLNSVWDKAIGPAIRRAGYEPIRIDGVDFNSAIVDQIMAKIRQSKFVIADLTMHRNGVYFEAGFAFGLGREVIFTCEASDFDENKHFDVQHFNFLLWEKNKLKEFSQKLSFRVERTLGRGVLPVK